MLIMQRFRMEGMQMKNERHIMYGKTAIVTGAAGGIGAALCRKLASYGMNLVITGRREEALEKTAQMIRDLGAAVEICVGDICAEGVLDEILNTAQTRFGGVDILINNAGISHRCLMEEMTEEQFDDIMKVNVRAPYFLCQKALPYLRRSTCATIINICSVVAHKGYPMQSVYAASKHALLGLSKSLANEVYKDNIRVHVISPGSVYTDMIAMVRPDLSPEGMILPEDIADIMGFYLERRKSNAVIDEIEVHRVTKEPFA